MQLPSSAAARLPSGGPGGHRKGIPAAALLGTILGALCLAAAIKWRASG